LFGSRGFRRGGTAQFDGAQLVGIGQLVQILQTEFLEEDRRGLVQQRTAWLLGATGDTDQFTFQQGGHNAVHSHTAHGFNIRAGNGLAIGDDGKRLDRRLAHARDLGAVEKLFDPDGVLGSSANLKTFGDFLHHQATAASHIIGVEISQRLPDFLFLERMKWLRLRSRRTSGRILEHRLDSFDEERFFRRKKQRLNDQL